MALSQGLRTDPWRSEKRLWSQEPGRRLKMNASQRADVSFTDVAASFTEEEWEALEEWQRRLYGSVMREIHSVLLDLGYCIENTEVLFRITREGEPRERGRPQEALGPDIMLRINYQGPRSPDSDPEDSQDAAQIMEAEGGLFQNIKQEDDASPVLDVIQCPVPGPVNAPFYSADMEESKDDVVLRTSAGEATTGCSPIRHHQVSRSDRTSPPCRERTRRRKGVARRIKPVAALHASDQNQQTEPNEAPRLLTPRESSDPEMKAPYPATPQCEEEEVYPYSAFPKGFGEDSPISFQQRGQTFIICCVCGKTFCNNSSFQVHMRTHTGERPYQCADCEKSFIRSSHLKIHRRTHTGERPYQCSECDKSFRDNSSFARHQRIHTGEKPYQCPTCAKHFRKKSNLKDHQRTHTGERPYKCQHCDKSFHQKSNLRVHERNHHADNC